MKVSVIIPVYNAQETLSKSVESLYSQDLEDKDFEVILVNDGSTDNSLKICQDLSSKHCNIKVIDKANNGVSSARNAGIKAAKGSYLTLLDNDDALVPGVLKLMVDCLDETNADVAIGNRLDIHSSEMDTLAPKLAQDNKEAEPWRLINVGEYVSKYTDMRRYELFHVWRTSFIKHNCVKFPEQLHLAEDVLFTITGLLNTERVVYTKYNYYMYQTYEKSVIHNVKMINILSLINAIPLLLPYWGKAKAKGCLPKIREVTYHQMALMVFYVTHTPELWARRKEVYRHYRQTVPFAILGRTLAQRAASIIMFLSPSLYINIRKRL